jgi:DNA-directed RNA polymerase subunit E'/Rpb7
MTTKSSRANIDKTTESKEPKKRYGPYIKSLLERKIFLKITEIGQNIKPNLERMISSKEEGKCTVEGYIRPGSTNVINYSSGKVNGEYVEYHVVYECMICYPVEGMDIECVCKTLTKAGIHAEVIDQTGNIPITIFISRDHHMNHHEFGLVKEDARLLVKIIGIRFELNDPYICAIGRLLERIEEQPGQKRLKIHE